MGGSKFDNYVAAAVGLRYDFRVMLLAQSIGGSSIAAEASALVLPRDWLAAVLARAETEAAGYWFEILDHPGYGQTLVIVCRRDCLGRVLSPVVVPPREAGRFVLIRIDRNAMEAHLESFTRDFGLLPSVARVFMALLRSCSVRGAAALARISYETAREHLELARLAIGAENLPHLVTLAGLAAGARDADHDGQEADVAMSQVFGLTVRQVLIAGLSANGLPRAEVARRAGVSDGLVKKELAIIFAATGVAGAIGLARIMVELRLLAMHLNLAERAGVAAEAAHDRLLIAVEEDRVVAANDYGPEAGMPVLVLHSSMTTRSVNRGLIETLQKRGFRPISIDRPGFGDTSDAPVDVPTEAYFELAARDLLAVGAKLGIGRFPIVSRGAAQVALALHGMAPDAIAAAIVMNPDPDAISSSRRDSFLAKLKRHFVRRPWAVRAMARWFARLLTLERVRDHLMRAAAGCLADQHVMAEEANVQDYCRSLRGFRAGKLDGFVREQVAIASMARPAPVRGTRHFRFLVGEHDTLHDPVETLDYWREVLPDAEVRTVPDAGRYMSYSHSEVAVSALIEVLCQPARN